MLVTPAFAEATSLFGGDNINAVGRQPLDYCDLFRRLELLYRYLFGAHTNDR